MATFLIWVVLAFGQVFNHPSDTADRCDTTKENCWGECEDLDYCLIEYSCVADRYFKEFLADCITGPNEPIGELPRRQWFLYNEVNYTNYSTGYGQCNYPYPQGTYPGENDTICYIQGYRQIPYGSQVLIEIDRLPMITGHVFVSPNEHMEPAPCGLWYDLDNDDDVDLRDFAILQRNYPMTFEKYDEIRGTIQTDTGWISPNP